MLVAPTQFAVVPPDDPEVPEDPDVPEEPEVPDDPDVPDVPEVPDDPEEPEVPDEPDEPDDDARASLVLESPGSKSERPLSPLLLVPAPPSPSISMTASVPVAHAKKRTAMPAADTAETNARMGARDSASYTQSKTAT